jgi:hypothetical protein
LGTGIVIPDTDAFHVRAFDIVGRFTGRDIMLAMKNESLTEITDPVIIDLIRDDDLLDRSGMPNLIPRNDVLALSLVYSRNDRGVTGESASMTSRVPWTGGRLFALAVGACPN